MEDPKYAEAVLIESKPRRSSRQWNVPRDFARSAVEFVQVPGSRNPKPPFLIFAAQFDIVITQARRINRIVRVLPDSSGRRI